jgi:predicted Zn-dependent protease
MQLQWQGHYLDGKSADRRAAVIQLEPSTLRINLDDGPTLVWPYEEIQQTQGFYAGEQVRLERGGEFPEILLVSDGEFLAALHRFLPRRAARFHNPAKRSSRLRLTVVAALASVAIIGALYLWGIPTLASLAAPWVPILWEERLGQSVMQHLAPDEQRCADPARLAKIEQIVSTLTAAQPGAAYQFRVYVVNNPIFNALAAPGGHIVIFRGLLDKTGSAEELAGVLAHELQHVLSRHVTRALLEHASTSLLVAAVAGDASGIVSFGLETAQMLAQLRFNRYHEMEADAGGLKMMLAAKVDPAGMIAFFETVNEKEKELPAILTYLSTHPRTEERIGKLKSEIARSEQKSAKLLPGYDWHDIKKICPAAPVESKKE